MKVKRGSPATMHKPRKTLRVGLTYCDVHVGAPRFIPVLLTPRNTELSARPRDPCK